MSRCTASILLYITWAILLSVTQVVCASTDSKPVVRVYIFSSPECSHCRIIQKGFLPNLADRVGCIIKYKLFDIDDMVNYRKLVEMEEKYGDTDNQVPVVFIGKDILSGEEETEKRLEDIISKYAKSDGVSWPDDPQNTHTTQESKRSEEHSVGMQIPAIEEKTATAPGKNKQTAQEQTEDAAVKQERTTASSIHSTENEQQEAPVLDIPAADTTGNDQTTAMHQPSGLSYSAAEKTASDAGIYLALFYQTSCKECDRIFYLLKYLKSKNPQLVVREFDLAINRNKVLYEAIAKKSGVPERRRLTPATVFIGSDFLLLDDIKQKQVEALLVKYRDTGSICPWDINAGEAAEAQRSIVERFKALGPLAVISAGLLDGINPCAFTTLIFFISYLFYLGKKGKEILAVGIAFTSGVFIAYFLIGYGAFSSLKFITDSHAITHVVNLVVASGALILGALSFLDFLKARKSKYKDINLQLPGLLKKRIHETVRTRMRTPKYVLGAFLAGLVISILEVVCTGQVYLPTIIFVTSRSELREAGLTYLLLYNLMFILPLVVMFIIAYCGTTSERLASLASRHVAPVKLATALLFMGLGALLVLS